MNKPEKRTQTLQPNPHPVEEHFIKSPVHHGLGRGIPKELAERLGVPVAKQQ